MSEEILEGDGPPADEGGGVPAWVMTFADLMTLLMCFFVLLLAFSEMDIQKFKQLSGSVKEAFGVQTEVEAKTIPKGTSIIAQEFSPGIPEPTPLNQVRQFTLESDKNSLDFESDDEIKEDKKRRERAAAIAKMVRIALGKEIKEGDVAVRLEGKRVIIQLLEKATFRSGYATMSADFQPVLQKIAAILRDTQGQITVSGHSDDVPIRNERFRSNWDLSSARAVTVLEALARMDNLPAERFMATGHADTRPLAPNDSAENRALNRRVDIAIVQDGDKLSEPDSSAQANAPEGEENDVPDPQVLAGDDK
ncbi:MAG: MotB family protein [Pseudomonadota bacterium]